MPIRLRMGRSISGSPRSPATGNSPEWISRDSVPANEWRVMNTKRRPWPTLPSGRLGFPRMDPSAGRVPGAKDAQDGISSAAPWQQVFWAKPSTSTAAAWTTSSRITRPKLPNANVPDMVRGHLSATGCTAPTSWSRGRRWRSPQGTSSPYGICWREDGPDARCDMP